jgi:hypothetical protein
MEKKIRVLMLSVIIFSILACGLFDSENTLALAKAITPDPDSVFIGEFQTTYPDSHPGAGLIYESNADTKSLMEYYKAELEKQGWNVTEVHNFDDFSQSVLITASKNSSKCYVTIENATTASRKITIKVE